MERSSIAKPIHPVLKACSIVAEMGPHELLHFVVEVVYLIQKIAFALHSVGFVACVDPPLLRACASMTALWPFSPSWKGHLIARPFPWVRQLQHLKKSSFVCKWGVK